MKDGRPYHRTELVNDSDYDIIARYGIEYRGLMNYCCLVHNQQRMTKVHWVMRRSLLRTLANKHRSSVAQMARKFSTTTETLEGRRKCIKLVIPRVGKEPLVATFGGIPFRRKKDAVLADEVVVPIFNPRVELVLRLKADRCEICQSRDEVQVHHIR